MLIIEYILYEPPSFYTFRERIVHIYVAYIIKMCESFIYMQIECLVTYLSHYQLISNCSPIVQEILKKRLKPIANKSVNVSPITFPAKFHSFILISLISKCPSYFRWHSKNNCGRMAFAQRAITNRTQTRRKQRIRPFRPFGIPRTLGQSGRCHLQQQRIHR